MKTRHLTNRFLILLVLFAPSMLFSERIKFNAETMSGTAGDKNNTTTLEGNAEVITESISIKSDKIELYGKDFRYIRATGKVQGENVKSKMTFKCGKITYDREAKVSVLEEDVELVDEEHDVKAQAQVMEYNENTEIATMQIRINLTQKDNVCTAAYAVYKKDAQILEMSGNPKIVQKGDEFRAQNITLDMDSQEITLSGRVKGSVTTENGESSDEDEEESEEASESSEGKALDEKTPEKADDEEKTEAEENGDEKNGKKDDEGENPDASSEKKEDGKE